MHVSWSELYWHRITPLHAILWPASIFFELWLKLKRFSYRHGIFSTTHYPIPLIVVDSITVESSYKTAFVVWLIKFLTSNGLRPAIISRNRPEDNSESPMEVTIASTSTQVGDNALLLAFHCNKFNCPVWTGHDLNSIGSELLKIYPDCNVLICEAGLHDYDLFRDLEILTLDSDKSIFGNGFTIPAGPLKDSLLRLNLADVITINEKSSRAFDQIENTKIHYVRTSNSEFINFYHSSDDFKKIASFSKKTHAIASSKFAWAFFDQLSYLNIETGKQLILKESQFTKRYIDSLNADIILIKEEDAVKCLNFIDDRFWILKSSVVAKASLQTMILNKLREKFMDTKLLDILVCPLCKGSLIYRKTERELICKRDRLAFPIRDGIPIMLQEEARLLPPEEEV